jgi:hypothetical protein
MHDVVYIGYHPNSSGNRHFPYMLCEICYNAIHLLLTKARREAGLPPGKKCPLCSKYIVVQDIPWAVDANGNPILPNAA